MKKISITMAHRAAMLDHVVQELPNEACGILAGKGSSVSSVLPMRNASASPMHFSFDPQEEIEALYTIESQKLEMIGIFHSHPRGPIGPSEIDLARALESLDAHLIWSQIGGEWQLHAYHIKEGRSGDIELILSDE